MHWLHVWSSKASQRWGVTVTEPGSRFFLDYGTGEETFSDSQVVEFTRDSGKHEAVDFRVGDPATLKGLDLSDNLLYGCIPEFTEFVALESFIARGNHFTSYAPSASFPPGLSYIDLSGNSLTQRALDQILADISARLVELPATGFVRIDGAHMPAPSVDGAEILTRLEEKGWSTFTNDSAGWEWDIVSPAGDKSVRIGTKAGTLAWIDWAGAMDSLKSSGAPVTFSQTLAEGGMIRVLVDEAKSLVSLNLAGNGFGGEVLPLKGPESLVTLDLAGNAFTGRVGSLPGSLEYLDLHSNAVSGWDSGPVPVGLTFLDMRENSLGQDSVDSILRDFAGTLPREDTGTLRLRKNAAPSVAGEEFADALRDAGWTVEHDGDNVYSLALTNAEATVQSGIPFTSDDPCTVSLWVKYSATTYLYYDTLLGHKSLFKMRIAAGIMTFEFGANWSTPTSSIKSGVPVGDGRWHHVVVTYDGSGFGAGAKMWVDGVDVTVMVTSGTVPDTSPYAGFESNGGTDSSVGLRIDEATIWAHEFSQAEISELYNGGRPKNAHAHSRSSLLRAWWKMGDSDTAPTILDHAPIMREGLHSVTYPTVMEEVNEEPVTAALSGYKSIARMRGVGGALTTMYYGISDSSYTTSLSLGNRLSFDKSAAFSISLWVFLLSSGPILSKVTDSYANGYEIERNGENFMFYMAGTGKLSVKTSEVVPLRQWTMLTVAYNGSGLASGVTLYINGVEATKTIVQDNLTGSTVAANNLRLGTVHYTYKSSLKACHVSFHSKALTGPEVAAIYNGGIPTDLRKLPSAPHLIAYFFAFSQLRHDFTMTSGLTQASFVEDTP